jgi:NAD(P)-dependent dehydrogenase (short-subunit alcohol dehydrogenase family)
MAEQKVVLITGVSSGIGQAIAQSFVKRGFTTFGTSRNPSRVATMPGLEVLPLDVCLDESVKACVDAVVKRVGRLDILINNAGYLLGGAIEEITLEEMKAQFETNFFGAVRMVKTVLPIMRKQGSGQIINISSGQGLTAFPFLGSYAASKFALEGFTEALRHEVKPFHIKVSLVEPGFIKTQLYQSMQLAADRIINYDLWQQRVSKVRDQYVEKAPDPMLVAECVLSIIENKSPGLRHPVCKEVAQSVWMRRFLPESMFEKGVRRFLHLDVKE